MNAPLPEIAARSLAERGRRQAEVVARARRRCARRTRCSGGARTPCPTNATASPPTAQQPLVVALPETERQVAGGAARSAIALDVPVVARGAGTGPLGRRAAASARRDASPGQVQPHPRASTAWRARRRSSAACATSRSAKRPRRTACTTRPIRRSQIACTIGGNVAENSGGVHCLKYGLTLHNVLRVRGFTVDGEPVEFGSEALDAPGLDLLALVDRQRRHARRHHRSHRQAAAEAAAGALHHGQLRRRAQGRRRGRRASSPPASSRPASR